MIKKISKEFRKRINFTLKLLLLAAMIFTLNQYPNLFSWTGLHLQKALLTGLIGNLVISLGRIVLVYARIKRNKKESGYRDNVILGINRIAIILQVFNFLLALLLLFYESPREFFTGLSLIAAAIAIVSKEYLNSFMNGMLIMFSDQLSLDDYVQIKDYKGRIVDVNLVNIKLLDDDENLIIVPNNLIQLELVVNFSKGNAKKVSIEFEIPIAQLKEINQMEAAIVENLRSFSKSIVPNSPDLRIHLVSKDKATLKFQYILGKTDKIKEKEIRRAVLLEAVNQLNG